MRNIHRLLPLMLVALVSYGMACAPPPRATPTAPAPTSGLLPTATPQRSPSPAPVTVLPTLPVPSPAPTTAPTGVPFSGNCSNRYTFVADVSIPDNSPIPPGQTFTKTWQVRNTGTCTWGDGYALEFAKGQAMTAVSSVQVPRTPPGETADLSVLMTAPAAPGNYEGYWALKNPLGIPMTPNLWVKIQVP